MPLVYFKNFSGDLVYPAVTFLAMGWIYWKENPRVLYVAKLAMNSQKSSNVSLLSAVIIGMYLLTQLGRNLKLSAVCGGIFCHIFTLFKGLLWSRSHQDIMWLSLAFNSL